MDTEAFPGPDVEVPTVEPEALRERIDAGEELFVLDARASDEYGEWRLEGEHVETLNVPYFDLLDGLDGETLAALPADRPVVVVCAKGGASEYVAGLLAEADRDVAHLAGGMSAWAGLYEADEVALYEGPGTLVQYRRPATGCLSYLLHDGDEAAVVDPLRAFADRYLEDAGGLGVELRYAFDTHVHADHLSGLRALADRGVEPVVPAAAADRGIVDAAAFDTAADGEAFAVGEVAIEALATPGHTTGMTTYRVGDGALLTGDGLFVDSVGRPDLEAGADGALEAAARLHASLHETVLAHDDGVVVGGAHYGAATEPAADGTYTATIAQLSDEMHALSLGRDAFVDLVLDDVPPRPANHETIVETNLGRRSPDDGEAFRLELGPNNCAATRDPLVGD